MNYNNNYFPASYPSIYPMQYQQQQVQQNQNQQPVQQPQMMTPPTIHAEIVQVGSREEGVNFPVGAGQTQMMMLKDDSAIYIKSAFPNGQSSFVEYKRKENKTATAAETNYVTREEFERRISEVTAGRRNSAPQRKERSE